MTEILGLLFLIFIAGLVLLGLRHLLRAGYLLSMILRDALSNPSNAGIDGGTLRSVQDQMKKGLDEPDMPYVTPKKQQAVGINVPKIGTPSSAPTDMVEQVNALYGQAWGVSFNGISREQGLLIINSTEIAWQALNIIEDKGTELQDDDNHYVMMVLAELFKAEKYHDDILTMRDPEDTASVKHAVKVIEKSLKTK